MSSVTRLIVEINIDAKQQKFIEITDKLASIKAFVIDREDSQSLPVEWDKTTGIYILLSHIKEDGSFSAYVGLTNGSFQKRMRSHIENKEFWDTAILFRSFSIENLNKLETAYLEGALVDAVKKFNYSVLTNKKKTGENTFPSSEVAHMDNILNGMLRILLLRGYSPVERKEKLPTQNKPADYHPRELPKFFKPAPIIAPESSKKADAELKSSIENWRREKAKELGMNVFIIFSDKDITGIVNARPKTLEELANTEGVSTKRVNRFSDDNLIKILNA